MMIVYVSSGQTLCIHLPGGSTLLRKMMSWPPSWKSDIISEIQVQFSRLYLFTDSFKQKSSAFDAQLPYIITWRSLSTSLRKPKDPPFQIGSGWNSAELFFKQICIDWRSQILIWCHTFQGGSHAMTFHAKKCCHQVSAYKALPRCVCNASVSASCPPAILSTVLMYLF